MTPSSVRPTRSAHWPATAVGIEIPVAALFAAQGVAGLIALIVLVALIPVAVRGLRR